jgi:iron complex transport system substrate-binding protein
MNFNLKKTLLLLLAVTLVAPNVIANPYKRIVSLAPSATEILFAMKTGDQIVGVTNFCDYPEEAQTKPKVGGFTDHNLEAIILREPDLVVMTPNSGSKLTYERLQQIGIESLVVPVYGIRDLRKAYQTIGEKIEKVSEATQLVRTLDETIQKIQKNASTRPQRTVAFVTWRTPLVIPGKGTLESDILNLAGGQSIGDKNEARYPQLSIEFLLEENPDIIIDANMYELGADFNGVMATARSFWQQYSNLKAVKSGELYLLKGDAYSVPGPRTIDFMNTVDQIFDSKSPRENASYERIKI